MANTYMAAQSEHMPALKNILHQPIALAHAQGSVIVGHYAGCILTAVLQND